MTRPSTRLEVAHDGTKWTVREHGIGRLTSHNLKREAEAAARVVAATHAPSDLTIRNLDGTVNSQEHYPRR